MRQQGEIVRAAVIGLGRMGSTFDEEMGPFSRWQPPHAHAACYRAAEGVALVAGADSHAGQREAFGRKWGLDTAQLYDDYHEMLARERPEIVSICTSAKPRAAILRDVLAADAGVRAIWAEKPMAISLAEADEMVESCRQAGVLLAIGASRCWDPIYNRMRELIDLGEIGDVLQVIGLGRCALSHNGSHLLTLVAYLAGGPHARCSWVFGHMEDDARAATDDDLSGNGYLQFENGVQAFVRAMPCGAADWEFEVIGTKGRLRAVNDADQVEFWKVTAPTLAGRRREPARQGFPMPVPGSSIGGLTGHSANLRTVQDLLAGLRTGKEPNCNGEAGRQALEIAIALRESHRRGGVRVDLPLVDRSLRINSSETLHGDEPAAVRRARAAAATAR
ncbi:MAG: Gfo/Idh/MocA family oxidoreductase [Chloroflexi bacterium]|nr:Gfo/Idh/MocA family oxidoreductase [Chloroflexota bacterium]